MKIPNGYLNRRSLAVASEQSQSVRTPKSSHDLCIRAIRDFGLPTAEVPDIRCHRACHLVQGKSIASSALTPLQRKKVVIMPSCTLQIDGTREPRKSNNHYSWQCEGFAPAMTAQFGFMPE